MKEAMAALWPEAKQLLCIFHVDKNIQTNLAKKWKKSAAGERDAGRDLEYVDEAGDEPFKHNQVGFMTMWRRMAYAPTSELLLRA